MAIVVVNNSFNVTITHKKLKDRVFDVYGVDLTETLDKMAKGSVHTATFKQYIFHVRNGYIIVTDSKTHNEIVLTPKEIKAAVDEYTNKPSVFMTQ